ncbi:hypothetical protein ACFE04_030492 [Oxalis oulophora]
MAPKTLLLFLTLVATTLTLPPPTTSSSFSLLQLKTLTSLSQSLFTRVANLRAARGDHSGYERAKLIADKMGGRFLGLGFWWSVGWNYVVNCSVKDLNDGEFMGAVLDANELLKILAELTRSADSVSSWNKIRNGQDASKRLIHRLLNVFHVSGPLKQVVETLQVEVVGGGLFKDCLEIGGDDLKGLVQILKDVTSQFQQHTPDNDWRDL